MRHAVRRYVLPLLVPLTLLSLSSCGNKDDSADPSPKATTERSSAPTPTTAKDAIGIKVSDYDLLNVQPSAADVDHAMEPLTDDGYTPEQAVVEFGKRMNVFTIGGKIDNDDGDLPETQASSDEGNRLLAAIFDQSLLNGTELDDFRRIRTMVANRFNHYEIAYTPRLLISRATGKRAAATAHEAWSVSLNDGMTFNVDRVWTTNFEDLDREDAFDNPNVDESHSVPSKIQLEVVDGIYRIKSLGPI